MAVQEIRGSSLTDEDLHLAYILGWLVQLNNTYHLDIDDFVDRDISRWGRPSRYSTCNDREFVVSSNMLHHTVMLLLNKYFGDKPFYPALVKHFQNACLNCLAGIDYELHCNAGNYPEEKHCSWEDWKIRVEVTNQDSFFSGWFTAAFAMTQVNLNDCQQFYQFAKKLLLLFVIQDDYRDSFGNDLENEPEDRDIRCGYVKWMYLKAVEICNEEEREILKKHYGKDNEKSVQKVKQLYRDIKLPELAEAEIKMHINNLDQEFEKLEGEKLLCIKTLKKLYLWGIKQTCF